MIGDYRWRYYLPDLLALKVKVVSFMSSTCQRAQERSRFVLFTLSGVCFCLILDLLVDLDGAKWWLLFGFGAAR
jgi:hypothetical protein